MSTASTDSGDRISIRLEGSLAQTPFAEILRRIAVEGRSGDLEIAGPSFVKTIYFDRGFVVFASSNRKMDRLGESMIEAGRISRHEFALASMLMKTTDKKFGEVLVEAGIVPEEELGRFVAAQVNRIVLSLFLAKQAKYRFVERPCSIPVDLMVSLSVYRILIEGVRRMSRKSLVLAGLPPLTTELRIVDQPPFSLDVDKLRPEEKAVLRAAKNGATIDDIVTIVEGHEGVTLRACYGLLCGGVLEPVEIDPQKRLLNVQEETGTFVLSEIRHKVEPIAEPPTAPPPPAPPPRAQAKPRPVSPAPTFEPPVARSDGFTLGDLFEGLARIWRTILGWFGRESAPPEPAARLTPPPRPTTPRAFAAPTPAPEPPAPASPPPKPVENIGVPSWSQVDDPEESTQGSDGGGSVGVPEWSLKSDEGAADDGPIVPSWSMKDPDEAPKTPVDVALEAREPEPAPEPRSERIEPPSWSIADVPEPPEDVLLDTSQVLDIEEDFGEEPLPDLDNELFIEGDVAGDNDISMLRQIPVENVELSQEIEIELDLESEVASDVAKLPETGEMDRVVPAEPSPRAEPSPPPKKKPAAPAPERARQATPAPSKAVKHRDYEPSAEERPGSGYEQEMRRMKQSGGEQRLLRDVKLHFRMRDWQGAVPLLEQLVAISPGKALYRGMLGRAMSRDPGRRKDAEEHFIEALRLSPQDPELHYWLGLYYKSFGLGSRAITEFRTTLRINPRHEGAQKQLGGGKKDDALGSVFKKLFG